MKKDFITLFDFSSGELLDMLDLADEMKKNPQNYTQTLKGKVLGMIFSKSSTRTRISFQTGIFQLGGIGLYFGANDLQLSRGETISDTAKVLSRYLDAIMIRTFSYQDVQELAACASIPVINGLTDYNHPCQAMADAMTIREKFGKFSGLKLAYVGDGNNVAQSLMTLCAKLGL
ncbi:MAG: ornithine carbamoyltransferase, partial [Deltaproteobacteria bacterium]|nr:ornithine carbamoyltransferase [Deltaproteobacteria bacterium]